MTIIMDTREKLSKKTAILESLERLGIQVVRSKLYVGDWTLLNDMSVCVDTKQGLGEVYSNLVQQHRRFRDECIRAKESGISLIILVEEPRIARLEDVHTWENPRIVRWRRMPPDRRTALPPVSSQRLQAMMATMTDKYGTEWRFCKRGKAGEAICEILLGF